MAIVTHTFIDHSNTIIRNSYANTGLNPVVELNYGGLLTRVLLYFDHCKVKQMVEDKVYPDITKLKHVLKLTNAASTDVRPVTDCIRTDYVGTKQRATSFDLIYFLIPKQWDRGRGFDYVQDLYVKNHKAFSTDGSSWYQANNIEEWDNYGVYTTDQLSREVDKFTSKEGNQSAIIIGKQHFDYGNEPIRLDITDTFNKFITGELENYGIGIAFSPQYENAELDITQYVGFFGPHTNTFYEPYIETTYDETIEDDRESFYQSNVNKLYFYASVGGSFVNLDELPICTIEGSQKAVKQATRGVYYVEVDGKDYEPDTMYYDEWSNIKYNGRQLNDVELPFVPKYDENFFVMGLPKGEEKTTFIPNVYGIKQDEEILQGDIRKINVDLNIPYTTKQQRYVDSLKYRLYVKEDGKETTVIDYTPIERGYNENYFYIRTNELIPSRYYVDIYTEQNMEVRYHDEVLKFNIVGSKTDYYN